MSNQNPASERQVSEHMKVMYIALRNGTHKVHNINCYLSPMKLITVIPIPALRAHVDPSELAVHIEHLYAACLTCLAGL